MTVRFRVAAAAAIVFGAALAAAGADSAARTFTPQEALGLPQRATTASCGTLRRRLLSA